MKIGLALGGGGALGIAHLALLEQIEKSNINVDIVAGSSAGAIIGGLYASGGIPAIKEFLAKTEEKKIFSKKRILMSLSPDTFIKRVEEILATIVLDRNFDNLHKKLIITATDINSGEAYYISNGNLVKAIMASSAYPGVFPCVEINGRRLCDGGVTNNLPTDILRDEKCDFIIASSLSGYKKIDNSHHISRAQIASRALEIVLCKMEKRQLDYADFIYSPPIEEYKWYHFDKMSEIYEKSLVYSSKKIAELNKGIKVKKPKGFFARLFSAR